MVFFSPCVATATGGEVLLDCSCFDFLLESTPWGVVRDNAWTSRDGVTMWTRRR